MNKLCVILITVFAIGSVAHARDHLFSHNPVDSTARIQLLDKQMLMPDVFECDCGLAQQQSDKKSVDVKNDGINPTRLWHKLAQIPSILENKFLPLMQETVQCVVARTHSQTQLTAVNDVLDLEQQAQDHRAQILDLINRFGQIYRYDPERAQQLYTLITQELSILKSIQQRMNAIKAQ